MTRAVPAFGYVYVALALPALLLGGDHRRAAIALFTGAAFAFLWFLGSLRAKLVRYDPDGFFASVVLLGGGACLALQAGALAFSSTALAAPAAAAMAAIVIASSLAGLQARKLNRTLGRAGIVGGLAVLTVGIVEGAADWTLAGSTVWASAIGFMVWVVFTATYLLRT